MNTKLKFFHLAIVLAVIGKFSFIKPTINFKEIFKIRINEKFNF